MRKHIIWILFETMSAVLGFTWFVGKHNSIPVDTRAGLLLASFAFDALATVLMYFLLDKGWKDVRAFWAFVTPMVLTIRLFAAINAQIADDVFLQVVLPSVGVVLAVYYLAMPLKRLQESLEES